MSSNFTGILDCALQVENKEKMLNLERADSRTSAWWLTSPSSPLNSTGQAFLSTGFVAPLMRELVHKGTGSGPRLLGFKSWHLLCLWYERTSFFPASLFLGFYIRNGNNPRPNLKRPSRVDEAPCTQHSEQRTRMITHTRYYCYGNLAGCCLGSFSFKVFLKCYEVLA